MPPRWLTTLIVLAWLLTSGRLLVRDLLPRLLPGQAPPFVIDLVEEARKTGRGKDHIGWLVNHGNRKVFRAECRVIHVEDDVFELSAEFKPQGGTGPGRAVEPVPLHGILVEALRSTYRVNAAGDLLALSVQITGKPQLLPLKKLLGDTSFRVDIDGTVQANRLRPKVQFSLAAKNLVELPLPEVRVYRGASVLLPLHPVNRIEGITLGQSWQMIAFDPLKASLSAFQGGGDELNVIRASVRPEHVVLGRGRRDRVSCFVIDYEGDDFKASTWVDRNSGLVLCQEATLGGDEWVMVRE